MPVWILPLLVAGPLLAAEPVPLTAETAVVFANEAEGRALLMADDAFANTLSRFDLQCRLQTADDVTLADLKRLVSRSVRPWDEAAMQKVSESLGRLRERLAKLRLPLPRAVTLVHTTGEEEANAAYTRGVAVVLPDKVLAYAPLQLDRLLAHELFHIASRHDGATRTRLYRIIGFETCEPIELPPSLAPRRITNPDAPLIDCTIDLKAVDGTVFTGAPILYSSTKEYDAQRGGTLFQHLTFRLLVVERRGEKWQPVAPKGEAVVIDPRKEPAFLEKVGQNTNYIIHPDEILADNFVRLVMDDQNLQTPRVVEEMRRVLGRQ